MKFFTIILAVTLIMGCTIKVQESESDNPVEPGDNTNHPPSVPSNPYPADGQIFEIQANFGTWNLLHQWKCKDPDSDRLIYQITIIDEVNNNPLIHILESDSSRIYQNISKTLEHDVIWYVEVSDGIETVISPTWRYTVSMPF